MGTDSFHGSSRRHIYIYICLRSSSGKKNFLPCMHVHILVGYCETSFDLFFFFLLHRSCRSNTKVGAGADEREGSYTGTCEEPPAGKATLASLLLVATV